MQAQQVHVVFRLTGKAAGVQPLDGAGLRPALLAGYRDLTSLRYDFPLVLMQDEEEPVQSLSALFDRALRLTVGNGEWGKSHKHALRLEREIRTLTAKHGGGNLLALWDQACDHLGAEKDEPLRESLDRLRTAIATGAEVVDCDGAMPFRLCKYIWELSERRKAHSFRAEIDKLLMQLSNVLQAELARSEEGLGPARLVASVGDTQRGLFDFTAMSRLLGEALPTRQMPEARRTRIRSLISVLQSQRFFESTGLRPVAGAEPYGFVFETCADAVQAYRERLPKLVELAKAVAIAKLEVAGEYDAAKHNGLFAELSADNFDPAELAAFPTYLVWIRADQRRNDFDGVVSALAAGLPAKVLVQTDDLLEPSPLGGEPPGLGLQSKQLVGAALGLGTFCVLQASASHLLRFRRQILRALASPGPALLSLFSGATGNAVAPYITAAMAMECRAFPVFTYDPSAGPDWASRFSLEGNPQAELEWPVHSLEYEDEAHQRINETLAFTFADFAAADPRYAKHFAKIPQLDWDGSMVAVSEFAVGAADSGSKVPYLLMVDDSNALQRTIVDDRVIGETCRCAAMWRNLQELGGIHNSHAARLLAQERQKWADQAASESTSEVSVADAAEAATAALPIAAEDAERQSDDPWIETARCTTCNECIQINDKMFGYNANKQALIVSPDAGTYRQLVEAAEGCQVSIIHPGKPRNPDEPGLDELRARAEPYL